MKTILASAMCAALLGACSTSPGSKTALPVPVHDQSALASRAYFYVGGTYRTDEKQSVMSGQMYVEVLVPKQIKRPYPLVLIHGAAQTATNWMGTPDGRMGWADYFVQQGYIVYMVDQPMRGRSAWHPANGPVRIFSAPVIESQFTATAQLGHWPQAKAHTQWPGAGPLQGRRGDPVFDAFYATQVESLASNTDTQTHNQTAGAALLDLIGPAVLLTHSQAGPFGWLIADARPEKVRGIVALEPSGPPFENSTNASGKARPWGPTDVPITYDPPVFQAEQLSIEQESPQADGQFACWLQKPPARQLINLKHIPVMLVVAEASYHAVYDRCTARYLQQAGVTTDYVPLQDHGLKGNGHMMMLEKNNLDIAHLIDQWVVKNIR